MTQPFETGTIAALNYVGGRWRPSSGRRTYEKRNPARPSEVVGEFPASGEEDVDAAVEAAAAAFPEWSSRPGASRGTILLEAADRIGARAEEIARDMTREMGKPLREARTEAARAATICRFFAGEPWRPKGEQYEQSATGSVVYTLRRPLGVVALITPWNFPAAIPAWKLAPALVYGNTVVLKLAQDAPLTGLHLARCFDEAGDDVSRAGLRPRGALPGPLPASTGARSTRRSPTRSSGSRSPRRKRGSRPQSGSRRTVVPGGRGVPRADATTRSGRASRHRPRASSDWSGRSASVGAGTPNPGRGNPTS